MTARSPWAAVTAMAMLCPAAWAQAPATADGAALFKQQCAACHSFDPSEIRQGPTLAGAYGRKPGTVPGFHYSPGFATVDFPAWDEAHLDAYLTNPQAVIPGAVMPYAQHKAPVRQAIIAHLKEQK